jgi:hypothetical protein
VSVKRRAVYAGGGFCVLAVILLIVFVGHAPDTIRGAVIAGDADPSRELPVGNVQVSLLDGSSWQSTVSVHSDTSGAFTFPIPWHRRRGQRISLRFQHPDYQTLDLPDISAERLCIAHLQPVARPAAILGKAPVKISQVVVRYSIRAVQTVNVGSAVKTFQIANLGNMPCQGRPPCSPDGKWKATQRSTVIDAGPDNEFRNARASCIAGPCPFTKIEIEPPDASHESRTIRATALNWSDTATFLFEAEVYKTTVDDAVRHSFPQILDNALTFTLPAAAEGVSIEGELDNASVVFPVGPTLYLSWAECQLLVNKDKTLLYRCELKPGYRFALPSGNSNSPQGN